MRKLAYPSLIKEDVSLLKSRLDLLANSNLRNRCEVLIWLKSGLVKTMKEAMALKGSHAQVGHTWWKLYTTSGLDVFLNHNYKGQTSPLDGKEDLEERLSNEGFSTINEARIWILDTYGIEYTENGLGNYFRARKIKLKTGRPTHPKKDNQKREAYKKNMRKN